MKYIKIVFFTGLLVTISLMHAMRIIPRIGRGGVPPKPVVTIPKGSVSFPFMPKPNQSVAKPSGATNVPTQQQKVVCSAAMKDISKLLPTSQDVQPVAPSLEPVNWLQLFQTQNIKVPQHNVEGELLPQEKKIQNITDIVQVCKPILKTEFQEEGFFEKKEQNNNNKEPIQKEQIEEQLPVERVEEDVQAEPEIAKEELQEDLQPGKDVQRQEENTLQEQQKKEQELFEQQEREKEAAQEAERQEIALREQEEIRLQEELRKQEQLALEQKEQELAKEQELLAKQEQEIALQEQQKKEQELFEQQEREKEAAQEAERQEIALREQEEMRLQEELRKQEQLALEQKEQELAQEQALQEQIRQEELAKEQELLAKQEQERVLQEQQKKEQEFLEQQEREKEAAQEAEREQNIRLEKQEQAQKELDILKQKETELVQNLEQEKEREKQAALALDELKIQELLAQRNLEVAQKKEAELIELLKKIEKQDAQAQEELQNSKRLEEAKAQALAEAKIKEDRAREALEKLEFEYQQKQRELERQQKEQELLHKVEQVDSAAQVEPFKQDFQPIAEAEPVPDTPQKVQTATLENYNDELAQARLPKKEIAIENENIVEKEPSEQPKEVRPLEEAESSQELVQQEQIKTESLEPVDVKPSEPVQELVVDVENNQKEPVSQVQLQTPVEERAINQVAIGTQHNIPTVVPIPSLPTIAEQPLLQEKQPVIGGLTSVEKVALPPRAIESLAETLSELKKEEGIKDSKKESSLAKEKELGSFETISKKPPLVPLGQKNLLPSYPGRSAETYPKIPARQESLGAQKPFNNRSDTYSLGQKIPSSGQEEQELLEKNPNNGEGNVQPSQKESWRSIIEKYGLSSTPDTEPLPSNQPSRPAEKVNRPELVTDYSQIPEESSSYHGFPDSTSSSGTNNQQQPKVEKPKKIKKEQPSESVWVALLQVFAMLCVLGLFFGIIIRTIIKFFRR